MTTARANVLRSNVVFRRMWSARAISFIGDGIALTALVLYIQDTRGTGTAVAALLLAQALPHLLGPVAGTVADRVDQRTLMIVCDLGRALLFGAAAWFLPSMGWLLVVMAAASTLDTLFAPAGRSAVPALVEDADLVNANAWLGTALNLQVALGPLIGGALVAVIHVRGALAVDAGSFLLSALLLLGVPKLLPSIRRADRERFMPEMRAGLAYARSHPVARAVVVTLFLGVAFAGIDNVALVFLAREELGAGPAGFGAVASAFGVGMLVASVMLSRRTSSITPRALFIGGWAMTGLGTLFTAVAPAVWFAVAAQAVSGAGNGADNVASDTLLQRIGPPSDARPRLRPDLHRSLRRRRSRLRRRRPPPRRHLSQNRLPHRSSWHLRRRPARDADCSRDPPPMTGVRNRMRLRKRARGHTALRKGTPPRGDPRARSRDFRTRSPRSERSSVRGTCEGPRGQRLGVSFPGRCAPGASRVTPVRLSLSAFGFDLDRDDRLHVGEQVDLHLVGADRADGLVQPHVRRSMWTSGLGP